MNPGRTRPTRRNSRRLKNSKQNHRRDECRRIGNVLSAIFPKGIFMDDADKFREIYLFMRILEKIFHSADLRFQRAPKRTTGRDTLSEIGAYSLLWAELIQNNTKRPSKRKSFPKLKRLNRRRTENKRWLQKL